MNSFTVLDRNRFFEVLGALMAENRSDDKVCFMNEVDLSSAQKLPLWLIFH
jgi:hypothetical protein